MTELESLRYIMNTANSRIVESWPCQPRVECKEEKKHAELGGSEHITKKVNV